MIELASTVVQSSTVTTSTIDGEVVMMNIENGTYSWLDDIGSEIWEMLKSPVRISEICEILTKLYDVDKERCEQDVLTFLSTLAERAIIIVEEDSTGQTAASAGKGDD
jgi:hypothetical protein